MVFTDFGKTKEIWTSRVSDPEASATLANLSSHTNTRLCAAACKQKLSSEKSSIAFVSLVFTQGRRFLFPY